jgi:hypothetical protein
MTCQRAYVRDDRTFASRKTQIEFVNGWGFESNELRAEPSVRLRIRNLYLPQ